MNISWSKYINTIGQEVETICLYLSCFNDNNSPAVSSRRTSRIICMASPTTTAKGDFLFV